MKAKTFKLIDALNREGIKSEDWGLCRGPLNTHDYFGAKEFIELRVCDFLYIYRDGDNEYGFIKTKPDYCLHLPNTNEVVDVFKI